MATALSALAVALGVALVVAVDGLRREARSHFEGAAGSWDLVVGPKGDPLRIVLGAVFQVGESTGTLPEDAWRRLREDPRVERAVPVAVGDSFAGFRLLGTTPEILGSEVRAGVPLRVAEGRPFGTFDPAKPSWEAIVGATVADATGLKVGDSFVASHGLEEGPGGNEHEEARWRVSGILGRTGAPMDRVVLIPIEAFWAMKGHDPSAGKGAGGAAPGGAPGAAPGAATGGRQVSAVLVRTRNAVFTRLLFGEIRASVDAQPAYPFQEVRNLFAIVGNADRLLLAVSALVVAVAALGILVSMTNTMNERRRDIALMRALGARRRVVAGLMVGEAATVGAFGAAAGLALGHALTALGAARITEWSGVRIRPFAPAPEEILVFAGAVALCALAGLVPAAMAYRTDVATGLEG
jgi:putative ABC transport system permease protein